MSIKRPIRMGFLRLSSWSEHMYESVLLWFHPIIAQSSVSHRNCSDVNRINGRKYKLPNKLIAGIKVSRFSSHHVGIKGSDLWSTASSTTKYGNFKKAHRSLLSLMIVLRLARRDTRKNWYVLVSSNKIGTRWFFLCWSRTRKGFHFLPALLNHFPSSWKLQLMTSDVSIIVAVWIIHIATSIKYVEIWPRRSNEYISPQKCNAREQKSGNSFSDTSSAGVALHHKVRKADISKHFQRTCTHKHTRSLTKEAICDHRRYRLNKLKKRYANYELQLSCCAGYHCFGSVNFSVRTQHAVMRAHQTDIKLAHKNDKWQIRYETGF